MNTTHSPATAERAVFVGDAVWDAEASARAQVPSIGLLSGGVSRDELESAGATEVFEIHWNFSRSSNTVESRH